MSILFVTSKRGRIIEIAILILFGIIFAEAIALAAIIWMFVIGEWWGIAVFFCLALVSPVYGVRFFLDEYKKIMAENDKQQQ